MPDLVMVTDYCLKHLALWFWFAAVISITLGQKLGPTFASFRDRYLRIAKDAQECREWLSSEFNRLLSEMQKGQVIEESNK